MREHHRALPGTDHTHPRLCVGVQLNTEPVIAEDGVIEVSCLTNDQILRTARPHYVTDLVAQCVHPRPEPPQYHQQPPFFFCGITAPGPHHLVQRGQPEAARCLLTG